MEDAEAAGQGSRRRGLIELRCLIWGTLLVIIMVMIVVNIHEAKAKLSHYLEAVQQGELVVICNRNRPVAELRAAAVSRVEPRPIGRARGRLEVPSAFFEPLPDEELDAFSGDRSAPPRGEWRVAEAAPRQYTARKRKSPRR